MTSFLSQRAQWALLAMMMLLLALTRYNHFFTPTLLADVTWAAFFLAGWVLRSSIAPVLLMLEVLVIDLGWSLFAGESNVAAEGCISPAYPFLVLAYSSLWMAGRWVRVSWDNPAMSLVKLYTALVLGVSASFVISNGAYFALADSTQAMRLGDFTTQVLPYWSSFLQTSAFWVSSALVVGWMWHKWHKSSTQNKAVTA